MINARTSLKVLFEASVLALLLSSYSFSQEPVPVLKARWARTVKPAAKPNIAASGPVRPVNPDEKFFQRKAREQRTDNPRDPYDDSIEGRSAAMDKAVQQSRAPQPDDVVGYTYVAEVKNDSGSPVAVIFWEYQFTEIAHPTNVVRRQFLCGVKLKNGERKELSAFSLLGPSDGLSVDSLAKSNEKIFDEKAVVNRIELSDGNVLQRNNWKYSDVKDAVERATSTPWESGTCKAL